MRSTETPVLYLDTNHISTLVRNMADVDVEAVRQLLLRRQARLLLSVNHTIELSDPAFRHRPDVGQLLDQCDLLWALPLPNLFSEEIRAAMDFALTGDTPPVRAYYARLGDAWGMPQDVVPEPSAVLETLAGNPKLRAGQAEQAAHSASLDGMKRSAAVYRDPLEPLHGMIADRQIRRTSGGIFLPVQYPPEQIVKRAGGLAGFPAYQVYNAILRQRFGDTKFPAVDNDMVDEWHAAHAPYVDIIALDRRTAARLRGLRLPLAATIVSDVRQIARLVTANGNQTSVA